MRLERITTSSRTNKFRTRPVNPFASLDKGGARRAGMHQPPCCLDFAPLSFLGLPRRVFAPRWPGGQIRQYMHKHMDTSREKTSNGTRFQGGFE